MAFMALNGDYTIPQPSGLKEEIVRQVRNRISVKGVQRRIWFADKRQVVISWNAMTLTQYAQLAAYIYNRGNTITYSNTTTGVSFTGYATAGESEFIAGASFLKDVSVTILEV